jgi:beta-xylosidase
MGPACEGEVRVDVSHLQEGDFAGLCAMQSGYGFIAVTVENGEKYITVHKRGGAAGKAERSAPPKVEARVKLDTDLVELKILCNFENNIDEAEFFYRKDGEWVKLGETLKMQYTLDHFMGYRFALCCYCTKEAGGYADFDYFRFTLID